MSGDIALLNTILGKEDFNGDWCYLCGTNQKGVREEPYFKIPVARITWPIFHTHIGIGNQILKNFVDIVDNEIEIKSPKKFVSESNLEILMRKYIMQ